MVAEKQERQTASVIIKKMGKKQSDIPEDVNKELESPKFGNCLKLFFRSSFC